MTPEFAKSVDPIFLSVLRLAQRLEHNEHVDIQTERTNIRTLIDDAERHAEQPGSRIRPEEFEIAKYGLVAWTDEVITAVYPDWENIKLEVEYWGPPGRRAFRFYVEGESMARNSNPDVAEVWYLALALGFKGDIRGAFRDKLNRDPPGGSANPDECRRAWARELSARIRQSRLPEMAAEPLTCDVAPLKGNKRLAVATVAFVGSIVISGLIGGGYYLYSRAGTADNAQSGSQPDQG